MSGLERIACPELPHRPADGHKGTFGRVLLIGGSTGMSGSIALSSKAALRSGSGLVTAAIPAAIQSIVAGLDPCYTTIGLPCASDGQLHPVPPSDVRELVAGYDAIGIGPGLGQSAAAAEMLPSVLRDARCPVILDADALNLAATHALLTAGDFQSDHPIILTPHPGEFSRLTGLSIGEITADREKTAVEFARQHGLVIVLKGAATVVTDGRSVYVNDTGNAGMATGGSGDVLTGVVTSFVGQGLPPLEAAALAVHLHGLAGDLAAELLSERALIATDVLEHLPAACRTMELRG